MFCSRVSLSEKTPQSFCDPRLNFEQSLGEWLPGLAANLIDVCVLDVAFLISNHFKKERCGSKQGENDLLYSELGGGKS
jgi:3-deoxy-7-phosphoheptulonate synthase